MGELYAAQVGINLAENFNKDVPSEGAAELLLQVWKTEMPEASSAYQPSGALPASALLLMTLGAVIGILLGVLAEAIIGGIAVALVILLAYVNAVQVFVGFIWCSLVVLLAIVALIALAAPFVAGGLVSSLTTTWLGRWGKNRNTRAAVILSVLSGGLSVLVGGWLFVTFSKEALDARGLFETKPGDLDIAYLLIAILGALMAMAIAGLDAAGRVEEAKFCEDCDQFMVPSELKVLGLGGLKAVARAVSEQKSEIATDLLRCPAGDVGKVVLFACPHCSRGYVELTAQFKARWRETKKEETKEESWLVASAELTSAEVERFRSFQSGR